MSYVLAVLAVGFIILIHETGHFIAAKLAGIPIRTFSIGFGPKLYALERGGTEYRLSLIPLGGYVMPDIDDEKAFFDLPVLRRVVLAAGGPAASMALPFFCFALSDALRFGPGFGNLLFQPLEQTATAFIKIASVIPLLFTHHGELSGIAGIVSQGGRFIGTDGHNLLSFTALMSINLAVLNLLPIPVLDGGKIVMYAMEKLSRKVVRLHYPLSIAGWALMLAVMIYATVLDVGRMI
ncbi:MAG: putative zinc metalloprotease [Syntrophorhabdus sp. PtaB.Bin047]|jgi:regulator of sigma E protease|nr:MAG: putative zinc metalloprotease [Syntrophorhabdus sp. PtaB.Bin047]